MLYKVIEFLSKHQGKKTNTHIDKNISNSYLFNFAVTKIISALRGLLYFRRFRLIFIGKNSTILCAHKIKAGRNINIGDNCHIDALSRDGIVMGNNISIHKRCIIECTGSIYKIGKGLVLGNNVGIGSNSFLGCAGGITIGDDTIIGNFVSFHSENHNYTDENTLIRLQGVNHQGIVIGKNCWIGAKSTILDGAIIEDGCIIAAGAVVTQGLYQKNSIYAGVPAKFIKKRF